MASTEPNQPHENPNGGDQNSSSVGVNTDKDRATDRERFEKTVWFVSWVASINERFALHEKLNESYQQNRRLANMLKDQANEMQGYREEMDKLMAQITRLYQENVVFQNELVAEKRRMFAMFMNGRPENHGDNDSDADA
ncbi:hypothetical protein L596_006493 [Steinernema carpocapsae]|uniref:Uncharacterized protein n=1 Tax=Steinernema carpocapsae TaxID=34508 RepID=A0A4U8V283_STECR|nr:hypothetical protein L596_006493 [Steinernema carpocapsae]